MNVLGVLLAMVAPFIVIAVLGGWTVPLIVGIVRNRRDRGGAGLIALGAVWGVLAVGAVVYVGVQLVSLGKRFQPETFDAATHAGETGQIVLPWRGACELTVWPGDGARMLTLQSDNGTVVAPAGALRVSSWTLTATDEGGRVWSMTGRPSYERQMNGSALNVSAAQPVQLSVGPPLTARVVVDSSPGAGELSMDFQMTDLGGASYTISGAGAKTPGFEVLNTAGQVVWSGDFEYG